MFLNPCAFLGDDLLDLRIGGVLWRTYNQAPIRFDLKTERTPARADNFRNFGRILCALFFIEMIILVAIIILQNENLSLGFGFIIFGLSETGHHV